MPENRSALQELCVWIMREIQEELSAEQDILDFAVARLTDAQRLEAIALIETALNSGASDAELERLWLQSGARIGIVDPSFYRFLFEELKNRLPGKPATFRF